MKVSIIIPTYNGLEDLRVLFRSLQNQDIYNQCEILVVDSSSVDGSVEFLSSFQVKVTSVSALDFDHGGTRSMIAREATGDVVVFLTQDVELVGTRSLSSLISVFSDSQIVAAYGRQLPKDDATRFASILREFNYPSSSHVSTQNDLKLKGIRAAFMSNSFAAYRFSELNDIGFFRDRLILGEDSVAALALLGRGGKIAYTADAMVKHSHNYSPVQEFKRYFDTGVLHALEFSENAQLASAQGEGVKYVATELRILLNRRDFKLIPESIFRNGLKFLGFHMGKRHKYLPGALVSSFSMHYRWWR